MKRSSKLRRRLLRVVALGVLALGAGVWAATAPPSSAPAQPTESVTLRSPQPSRAQPITVRYDGHLRTDPDDDGEASDEPNDDQEPDGDPNGQNDDQANPEQHDHGDPGGPAQDEESPDQQDNDEGEPDGAIGQEENSQTACESELPPHDGSQEGQRCAQTPIGEVPDTDDIPGILITRPADGATLPLGEPFVVEAAVRDLATGSFADPQAEYLQVPQQLNEDGLVFGHAHVVVQPLATDEDDQPSIEVPEARDLVYFQGLEDPADEDGRLLATIPGLEEPGVYRIQVNTSSTGHQPIVPPVAEQVAPVDVIRVRVTAQRDDASPGDTELDPADSEAEESALGQAPAPVFAVAHDANAPGDGIPPDPGAGAGDATGGGAGDGQPPAPPSAVAATPDTVAGGAGGEQTPDDRSADGDAIPVGSDGSALPFSGSGAADVLLLATGVLVAVGLTLLAVGQHRRRRPSGRQRRPAYQGRHLDADRDKSEAWPSLDDLLDDEPVGGEPDATRH